MAGVGEQLAKIGKSWPMLPKCWSALANFAGVGLTWTNFGQCWQNVGQALPNSVEAWPRAATSVRIWAGSRLPKQHRGVFWTASELAGVRGVGVAPLGAWRATSRYVSGNNTTWLDSKISIIPSQNVAEIHPELARIGLKISVSRTTLAEVCQCRGTTHRIRA